MKLSVQADVLNHIVSIVAKAAKPKATGLGAENIRIKIDKDKTVFTGTDLELQINAILPIKSEDVGEIAIPAQSFSQYLATLGESEKIDLEVKDAYLVVKTGSSTARFNIVKVKDFPVIEQTGMTKFAEVSVETMLEVIKHTVFAALKGDETRPVLNGVFFDGNKDFLTMVALDTFRMSVHKTKIKPEKPASFSITYRALLLLEKVLRDNFLANIIGEEKISILVNNEISLVAFKFGDLIMYVKVIEGTYPDYSSIVPAEFKVKGEVKVSDLTQALRRVGVFAQNSITKQVIFKIHEDSLVLTSEAQENGNTEQPIPASFTGEGLPLKIGFQYKFISEFVTSINKDNVSMKAIDSMSPVAFQEKGNSSYIHIIMPLKIA